MRNIFILISIIICFLFADLSATINNIPDDFPTIQDGIDACLEGDTVLVEIGVYVENLTINISNIVLASTYIFDEDTSSILSTIIDGDSEGSVIHVSGGLDSNTVICGLTVQNGQHLKGGGIYLDSASIRVCHNIIKNNRATSDGENYAYGGGIFCLNCSPIIANNVITYNISEYYPYKDGFGGGVCCYNSDALITKNLITQNSASGVTSGGAGIYCIDSNPTVSNNVIKLNTGNWGSGIFYDSNCGGSIYRNVIYTNYGGGILCRNQAQPLIANNTVTLNYWAGGITSINQSLPFIVNNIVWENESYEMYVTGFETPEIIYNDIMGGWAGEGNIDGDPLFVDPETGDFHLQINSPCIDAGDPESPLDPDSTRIDIGAFYCELQADADELPSMPEGFGLFQNYPNPFNASTSIDYRLPAKSRVTIEIFDLLGRRVAILENSMQDAGDHRILWNADNYASGLYICRLDAGVSSKNIKMLLIK